MYLPAWTELTHCMGLRMRNEDAADYTGSNAGFNLGAQLYVLDFSYR